MVWGCKTMPRERDSQRSKVYAAEATVFGRPGPAHLGGKGPDFKTLEECHSYLRGVRKSAWFQRRWPGLPCIELRPGKGARRAFARGNDYSITLPLWTRQRWVLLHELAHLLGHKEVLTHKEACAIPAGHGWQFCASYLELVYHELGEEAGDKLKAEFKRRGVKFKAPVKRAPLSEERKAQLREQLARVRV